MRTWLLWLVVVVLAGNGLFMLVGPEAWYHALPSVPHTGPFNGHFVRDIGCAFLTAAAAFGYFALEPARGRPVAALGLVFLVLHALVHVWDGLAGRASLHHLVEDLPGVFALPALAFWLVTSRR